MGILLSEGRVLSDLPSIGKDLSGKIADIVATGHFSNGLEHIPFCWNMTVGITIASGEFPMVRESSRFNLIGNRSGGMLKKSPAPCSNERIESDRRRS